MNDDQLADLAADLCADPGYASGRRRFPRRLSADEAADLALALCQQVDRGAAARERTAARQGLPIVCARGCNGCCEELVMAYQPEALLIARWLRQPEHAAQREAFLAAYPAWLAAVGDGPARLARLLDAGDSAGYAQAHRAQWQRRVLCAFNQDGACLVYAVRPTSCRNAHAVETSARCSGANVDGPPAARLSFAPLDRYLPGAEQALRAAHHALTPHRTPPEALCTAVYRLLQDPAPR